MGDTGGTVEYVIPLDLVYASPPAQIEWLLHDAESDDRMVGVPRYQPRYTEREQQIIHLLRWSQSGRSDG